MQINLQQENHAKASIDSEALEDSRFRIDALPPEAMEMSTGRRLSPPHDEIARLAFTLYTSRGRQDGHDIDDWLRAEKELAQNHV